MKIKSFKEEFLRHGAFIAVGILTVLSGFVLLPFRGETSSAATAFVPSETTLTVDTEDIIVEAKTDINNFNTFFTASSNLEIITNNYSGYTLRIAAEQEEDHDKLLGENDAYLASISEATTETDFKTISSFVGKFGYKPSKLNSDENTNYLPAPDSAGDVLDVTAVANSVKNTYEISLAARVDMSIVSGEYSNVYVYTVVANPVPYMISYDKNTEDAVSNLPETQVDDTTDEDMTLSSDVPVREHYTFTGWCDGTTAAVDNADTCDGDVYQPGDSFYLDHTTNNSTTLKAMWSLNRYEVTVNAGNGVNTLALEGWTGTGTGTLKKTFFVGDTVDLSTFTPAYKTAYSGAKYIQNDSEGTLSGTTYTVGDGAGDISISATTLDTPVCTMTDGAGKVYNRSDTTITATNNSDNYDTNTTDITYSFGYSTSSASNPLGNFSEAKASNTFKVDKDSHYGARYYGVKVVVTNKNDNTITANCTSGTGTGTGSTVANRATVSLVNARIDFDANGGTLSSANPVYVAFQGTTYYTARTNADTTTSLPTVTPPTGYTFAGWYTAATGGNKVVNSDGTLTGTAVSGWSNSDRQWVVTKTSNEANTNLLYARYSIKTNLSLKISFNSTYVSKVEVKSGSASGTTVGTVSTSGNTVTGLTYNTAYYLVPTYTTGSTLNSWAKDSGAVGTLSSTSAANPTYTIGDGTNAVTLNGKRQQYKVNLDKNGGTNDPTASVNATYYNTSLPSIATLPERVHAMSGFTLDSSATGATVTYSTAASSNCTSASDCKSTYTFNGWYKESGATTLVANTAEPPALQASVSGLTDSSKRWIATSEQTLYAGWIAESGAEKADVTLPTITKTGYTCKWTDGTNNYNSGAAITPSSALNLTGTCSVNTYTITVKAGNGIDTLALSGWTNTGTGTLTKKLSYGSTLDLSTFTPAYKTAYSGKKYAKNSGSGSLSGSNFTVGAGAAALTISATTLDTPVCTIKGGIGKVYNLSPTTITATDNSGNYDADSTNITYSFGYSGTTTGTLGNFSTADTVNTFEVDKDSHYGWRYYGVKVVVTNKNDSTITANCTSGTGTGTGETVANRTTVALVNARINFDSHDGTLSGTNPVYVAYEGTTYYTERGNINTTTSLPTVTPPTGYTFAGWYTAATGGSKVINANGTLTGSAVANFTNTGKQWVISSVSDNTTANMLHAHYDIKTNLSLKITFNSSHVSKVEVKTGSASGTTVGTVSTSGNSVSGLTYGETYYLVPTYKTGYKVSSWAKDSGAVGTLSSTSAANPTYTIGDGTNAVTLTATTKSYTVTLNKNGATNTPTASVNVRYLGTSLASITTMPERVYNVSITNNVGATVTYSTAASSNCTSASDCKSRYTFNGWYKEAATTNKIASDASTPVLQANTDYTDANGKWSVDAGKTLYAGWIAETGVEKAQVTLPTVTKSGYSCSMNTKEDGTGTSYNSGESTTPSAALALNVVCSPNTYKITLDKNGATNTPTASVNATYDSSTLSSSITNPQRKYTVTFDDANNTGCSVPSTNTLNYTYTFSGWTVTKNSTNTLIDTSGALAANVSGYTGANGIWIRANTATAYAKWTNPSSFTMATSSKTGYKCQWTDGTNTWDQNTAYNSSSFAPTSNITLHAKATPNTYKITLNQNNATTNSSPTSVNATYDSASLSSSITNPQRKYTIAFDDANNTGCSVGSTSLTYTYTFAGWTTTQNGSTTLIDTSGALAANVSGYTGANGIWIRANTATAYAKWTNPSSFTMATSSKTGYKCQWTDGTNTWDQNTAYNSSSFAPTSNITLHAKATANTYTIGYTLNNGTAGSNKPTSGTYDANVTISNPTKKVTITGVANGTSCTLGNATSADQTFTGWTSTTVSSGAKTGTSTSTITTDWSGSSTKNQYFKNLRSDTGTVTMVANWTAVNPNVPTISAPTGYTCKWNTKSDGTGTSYNSGAAYSGLTGTSGTSVTLHAIQTIKSSLSLKVTFAGTGVSSVKVCKTSGNCSGSNLVGTISTSGNSVSGLTYNTAYYLYPAYSTGYTLDKWAKDSGAVGTLSSTSAANPTYTIGDGTNAVTITGKAKSYAISLGQNNATTNSSPTSVNATYNSASLSSSITNPQRKYTITFNANGSSCSVGSSSLTYTYGFAGWTTTQDGSTILINTSGALAASVSGYTDANKKWTKDGGATVYAKWNSQSFTMPTSSRTGYTCKWNTKSDGTGTSYTQNAATNAFAPTGATTLYAIATPNTYTIQYAGNGNTGGSTSSTTCTYDKNCTVASNGFSRSGWYPLKWKYGNNYYSGGATVKNLATSGTITFTMHWITYPVVATNSNILWDYFYIRISDSNNDTAKMSTALKAQTTTGGSITYTVQEFGALSLGEVGANTCASNAACGITINTGIRPNTSNSNTALRFRGSVTDVETGVTYTDVSGGGYENKLTLRQLYMKGVYGGFRANYDSGFNVSISDEINWQINQMSGSGMNAARVIKNMYGSQEATNFFSGKSNGYICTQLYVGILGRYVDSTHDSGGYNNCVTALNNGQSVKVRASHMVNSDEAQSLFAKLGFPTGTTTND